MISIMYVLGSWLIVTVFLWAALPLEERSLGAVASIEIIVVSLWLLTVFFLC